MMKNYVTGLQHIGIPTNDLKKSLEFYEKLGFENIYQVKNGAETVAFLRYENLTLEIYENGAALERDGSVDHFALDTKHVEELYEKMKQEGYTMLTPGSTAFLSGRKELNFLSLRDRTGKRLSSVRYCRRRKV